jgi:hypothetical protein
MDVGMVVAIIGSAAGVAGVLVAVLQLRQGRRRKPGELPVSAHGDTSAAGILLPPTGLLPDLVCGRDDVVETLAAAAAAPDGKVHVLVGLGGCGKSTVALALARQCAEAGQQVWWLPVVDRSSVTSMLLGLARLLGASDGEVSEALAGRIGPSDVLWRQLESVHGWVLILDNADDPGILATAEHAARAGTGWLRSTKAGLVLMTSRTGDARAWGRLATLHPVDALSTGDGARVLHGLAPDAGDDADARKLAARLAGLPLALHGLPRVSRTGNLRLIHAATCLFRSSSMTSCGSGTRVPSGEVSDYSEARSSAQYLSGRAGASGKRYGEPAPLSVTR